MSLKGPLCSGGDHLIFVGKDKSLFSNFLLCMCDDELLLLQRIISIFHILLLSVSSSVSFSIGSGVNTQVMRQKNERKTHKQTHTRTQ